jgi:hypothetical protein
LISVFQPFCTTKFLTDIGCAFHLQIASRLSEANSYEEQAAFEEVIHGPIATEGPKLEDTIAAAEEIYVCSLAWVREQRSGQTIHEGGEPKVTSEFAERLPDAAVHASLSTI